jgi:hypothetical protein
MPVCNAEIVPLLVMPPAKIEPPSTKIPLPVGTPFLTFSPLLSPGKTRFRDFIPPWLPAEIVPLLSMPPANVGTASTRIPPRGATIAPVLVMPPAPTPPNEVVPVTAMPRAPAAILPLLVMPPEKVSLHRNRAAVGNPAADAVGAEGADTLDADTPVQS